MTTTQLELLLDLYKKAVSNALSVRDVDSYIKRASIDLDQSYVNNGKEDSSIKIYIEELTTLKRYAV